MLCELTTDIAEQQKSLLTFNPVITDIVEVICCIHNQRK